MTLPTICLYVAGIPPEPLRRERGSYVDWFAPLLAEHPVDVELVDGTSGALPHDLDRFAGIVITGSPRSLTVPEPWMEAAVELIRQAYAARKPLLGVCFGHQLIGAAFGGSVVLNPAGWEVSTCPVELSGRGARDPLFDGLPARFPVNLAHQDIVSEDTLSPLNGIELLAHTDKARVAAVAAGPAIRGVQFHPEMTGAIARTIVETRRDVLGADARERNSAEDHPDRLLERASDTPLGRRVFDNFIRHFALATS